MIKVASEIEHVTPGVPITQITAEKFRVDVTSADSPVTVDGPHDAVYAVDLTNGNVIVNLPPVTLENAGLSYHIYIERNPNNYTLTVNTAGTDTLRGQTSKQFTVRFDGFYITAHMYGTPHWDILSWMIDARTDEIKYVGGDGTNLSINTLQQLLDYSLSSGLVGNITISQASATTISISSSEWKLRSVNTDVGDCRVYQVSSATVTVPDGLSYLAINHPVLGGTVPNYTAESSMDTITGNSKVLVAILHKVGTHIDVLVLSDYSTNFPIRHALKELDTSWLEHGGGAMLAMVPGTLSFTVGSGVFYQGIIKIAINGLSSITDKFTNYYRNGAGGWTTVADQTVVSNQFFDNGTGTLASLSNNNRYTVHWVFVILNNPNRLVTVLGQVEYADLISANNASLPATLPPFAQAYGIGRFVGKIVVNRNAITAANVQSPFNTYLSSSTPIVHNDLGARDEPGTHSVFKPLVDTSTAFTFRKADGTVILTIDTLNGRVLDKNGVEILGG